MRTRQKNYLSLVDNFIQEIQKPENALGDYSNIPENHGWHFEFQIGDKLAWIIFDNSKLYKETVSKNRTFLRKVWLNGETALDIAEAHSRSVLKNFWRLQDEFDAIPYGTDKKSLYAASLDTDTNRLEVNGLHINLDDKTAIYEIFENHAYTYNQEKITYAKNDYWEDNPIKMKPPEFPNEYCINIKYQNGQFTTLA